MNRATAAWVLVSWPWLAQCGDVQLGAAEHAGGTGGVLRADGGAPLPQGGSPMGGLAAGGVATGGCTVQLGDVDGDGKIASADATAVANYLFVHAPLPHPEAADVDCDGSITEADANCISEFALGKFVAFRCDFSFGYGAPGAAGAGGTGAPCGLVSGDADGDGVVESTDEIRIDAFDTGQPVFPIYWIAADTNCDGIITSVDAMFIDQSLRGTRELLPCGAGGAGAGGAGGNGGAPRVGLLGDVNGDGVVDLSDADAVACHAGSCGSDLVHPEVADVNCDGAIDLWDAKRIAKYAQCALDHLGCEAR